jgi:hypothetical protein
MAKKVRKPAPTDDISKISKRVEKKIVKASEIFDPTKILVYARPKTGKTRLAASAPDVLLVDIKDRGTKSVRRDIDPNVYPVTQWLEIDDIYWYLKEGNHPYKSVALDGATGMQTLCMNFVLGEAVALDATRDPDMPTRQAWGKVGQLMKTQITNYVNLDMNVIFTALTRVNRSGGEDDDDIGGDETIGPAVSPSVAGHLEAAVDIIGYLMKRQVMVKKKGGGKKKATRKRLILEGSERYLVGDRTGVLPAHVDAPDLTELFRIINEGENSA